MVASLLSQHLGDEGRKFLNYRPNKFKAILSYLKPHLKKGRKGRKKKVSEVTTLEVSNTYIH